MDQHTSKWLIHCPKHSKDACDIIIPNWDGIDTLYVA